MQTVSIQTVLDAMLNQQDLPLDQVLERHFSPHYRQRTNGHWDEREDFVRHAQKLREVVASARIEILDELQEGNRYADRHRVHVTKRDGSRVVQEVYLFAEVDALGRFLRVEETTLMLEGAEADRGLGSAKQSRVAHVAGGKKANRRPTNTSGTAHNLFLNARY